MRPSGIVLLAMVLSTAWFSAYSVAWHTAHLTHKADLGQIDLAIWNTSRGRILQEIKDDFVSTRLTDHVELLFVPVSAVLWLWDDVRALLILQAAALASGAWPIYLLARRKLGAAGSGETTAAWGGAVFAIVYLLAPALQSAAVSEFHALPLAAPLIAWALWALECRQWGRFALLILLLVIVQEGMALLGATLGLYALVRAWPRGPRDAFVRDEKTAGSATFERLNVRTYHASRWFEVSVAIVVVAGSLAWFYLTTFVIIPHYAEQVYGVEQTPYVERYGALGDSFAEVLRALLTQPRLVLSIVLEPLRLRYLAGLLMPSAFLALLGPGLLLVSLPLLLANLLSSYPLQYSGELHYSAPLVPLFVLAGAAGLSWVLKNLRQRESGRVSFWSRSYPWFALILLGTMGWQIITGYTPLGQEFWRRYPGGWPVETAHDRLLSRFAMQIPKGAPLSAATDLYPHVSHRELIYQFPWLGKASWTLVDVSGTVDESPGDVRAAIEHLLASGWGVVDAADGYILLAAGQGGSEIPDEFYDFARVRSSSGENPSGEPVAPQHMVDVTFGDQLRLLGYDVIDDAKWRRTVFRLYWEVLAPLPEDTEIAVRVLTPDGATTDDPGLRAMPALTWYGPERWQPGEVVRIETLPAYLPREWAPAITVRAESLGMDNQQLLPVIGTRSDAEPVVISQDSQLLLQPWVRRSNGLTAYNQPDRSTAPGYSAAGIRFSDGQWVVHLDAQATPSHAAPGQQLPVDLHWRAADPRSGQQAPPRGSRDYTVFVHLRGPDGKTVAMGDGLPTWFAVWPTSDWEPGREMWDAHVMELPNDLAPGTYSVVVGWYDGGTGQRLDVIDDQGNVIGNEVVLTQVSIDPKYAPKPDLCCATVPECCASQPRVAAAP